MAPAGTLQRPPPAMADYRTDAGSVAPDYRLDPAMGRVRNTPRTASTPLTAPITDTDYRRYALAVAEEDTPKKRGGGDPLDALPWHWRHGPWSPLSYPSFAGFAGVLIWQARPAFEEAHVFHSAATASHNALVHATEVGDPWGGWVPVVCRGLGVLYMLGILLKQIKNMGGTWIFCTYTILSWSLLAFHLLLGTHFPDFPPNSPRFSWFSNDEMIDRLLRTVLVLGSAGRRGAAVPGARAVLGRGACVVGGDGAVHHDPQAAKRTLG